MGVTTAYSIWVEYCARWNNDRFPYPFLTMMQPEERVYTYMAAAAFAFIAFQILNGLHK
jgi:hypothetical protein